MNIIKIIFLSFMFVAILAACDDDDDNTNIIDKGVNSRVKRIVGENESWGKYELEFNYHPDGRLDRVWRLDGDEGVSVPDTLGYFVAKYDIDYQSFEVYDLVVNIAADSIAKLKELYPGTYEDTLRHRRAGRLLYKTVLEDNHFKANKYRPRRNNKPGTSLNSSYMNVSAETQIAEINSKGDVVVVRCNSDKYKTGGYNDKYTRTVYKYEFSYEDDVMTSVVWSKPDTYNDSSWGKIDEFVCSHYSTFLTSIDSEKYKMRRSANKIVIAEPGKNTTYILNDKNLAVEMTTSDGETAKIEYEDGRGNFSTLYATPLDRALGKVWLR